MEDITTISAIGRSYDQLGKAVANLTAGDLTRPTPCPEWDVRAVLNHVLGASWMFTLAHRGEPMGEDEPGDLVGDHPAAALSDAVRANLEAWRRDSVLEGELTIAPGTFPAEMAAKMNAIEAFIHAWDVAKATDQDATLDPDVAGFLHDFALSIPLDSFREMGAIGPEVAIPASAPVADRLLGLCGRRP